nr:uncharacterized protein LOC118076153 [Zootoca vivipara]
MGIMEVGDTSHLEVAEHSPATEARDQVLKAPVSALPQGGPQQSPEQPVAPVLRFHIPSPGLLEDEQVYILGVIQSCQAAELRGLRTLKCSKQETAKAILDILGPLEHFRDRPLTLALALEALLQLSTMRPKFSCDMVHRTMEAVIQGPEKEEEKRTARIRPGGKRGGSKTSGQQHFIAAGVARKFPRLRMTVVRPDLACFRQKPEEDDIVIEDL